jgi:RNA polymerase sigma-70 factor (ECF subfamily)
MTGVLTLKSNAKDHSLKSSAERFRESSQDRDLVVACRSGSLLAFEHLYKIHGPKMKSIALNLLGNVADAEDAVQESFLKIYLRMAEFRGEAAFPTWIFRLLVNTCYDLARKRKDFPGSLRSHDGMEKEIPVNAANHPLRLTLERLLQRLNTRTRSVFLLFETEGFSHREIAGILEIREGTSKALLFNAKRKLQHWINESTPGQ